MKIVWGRSIGWNLSFNGLSHNRPASLGPMKITQIITDGCDCYPWTETFVMWPRKSVTGAPLFWTKAYKRRVWVVWGTGFHMEPHTQYATAFDLLTYDNTYP